MKKIVVVIVGLIFLGVGIFMFIKNQNLVKNCTVETEAIVVEVRREINTDPDGSAYMYYTDIEYKVNDQVIKATLDNASSEQKYEINQKMVILYNPNKTSEYMIKGDSSLSIFSYIFIAAGALVTIYGIVTLTKKEDTSAL